MKILARGRAATSVIATLLATTGCGREAQPPPPPAETNAPPVGEAYAPPAAVSSPRAVADRAPLAATSGIAPITAHALVARIAAARQKGTLVNAWASWCGPCRRELPMLQALSANLGPQGVQVLLVSVDNPSDAPKAASFLKDNGITLESYIVEGSLADFKLGINPRWPGMLPASFLFDESAKLRHFWGGEAFENELLKVIDDFVAGRPIESETRFGLAAGKLEK